MLISWSNLKSLPVETKSKQYLGRICEIFIDSNSGAIMQYEVKNGKIRGVRHLISRDQILEITKTKIVVHDAVLTELVKEENLKKAVKNISPALTSNLE